MYSTELSLVMVWESGFDLSLLHSKIIFQFSVFAFFYKLLYNIFFIFFILECINLYSKLMHIFSFTIYTHCRYHHDNNSVLDLV